MHVHILVGPVLVELERHHHTIVIARGGIQCHAVELGLEPTLDGVDAEAAHRAEIALIELSALGAGQARVLRVVADTAHDRRLAIDEVLPGARCRLLNLDSGGPSRCGMTQATGRVGRLCVLARGGHLVRLPVRLAKRECADR